MSSTMTVLQSGEAKDRAATLRIALGSAPTKTFFSGSANFTNSLSVAISRGDGRLF
jgi:hypothetical protein